jgi:DNA polymerase III subunit delta
VQIKNRVEIDRFLQNPDPSCRAALIHGRDFGVVRERAQMLARAKTEDPDDPFNVARLTEGDIDDDPGRLEAELMAVSMMGGARLVRLRLDTDKAAPDRAAAEALAEHLAGAFNPDAFFLIEATGLARDSKLKRMAEDKPGVIAIACWSDEAGDLARLTRDALAAEGVALSPDALALFVSRLPQERGVARQEIERLVLFLGPKSNRTAQAGDLEEFLGVEPEASLADAAQDAFGGRLAKAHAGLVRAAREGESGPAAVRAVSFHLARLRRMGALIAGGEQPQAAAKKSGVFWRNEKEMVRQARAWTGAELDKVQGEVLAADLACKTAGSPDLLIAERLALTIAGRARRLGL